MELTKRYRVIKTHQFSLAYRIMKLGRMIVIFTVILAMPLSSWATVMMASHCQISDNTTHTMIQQLDGSESVQCHDQMSSEESNNQSDYGCDSLNCSASVCGGHAMINGIAIDSYNLDQNEYQIVKSLAYPSCPDQIFRPPISLS